MTTLRPATHELLGHRHVFGDAIADERVTADGFVRDA
jgi:hypothetical protein